MTAPLDTDCLLYYNEYMGKKKSKINLNQLRIEIQYMTVRRQLYKVLKEELTKLGYWKKRKRGKPNPMFTKR